MYISILKTKGKKGTIVTEDLQSVVNRMKEGTYSRAVLAFREIYPFTRSLSDGRVESDLKLSENLPRLCFAAELKNINGERRMMRYNGMVVLEASNLEDYDDAIALRDAAARMPYTLLAFIGASGRSVHIVCRGELYPDGAAADGATPASLPSGTDAINRFHRALYQKCRTVYNSQLGITLDTVVPDVERTVYVSSDTQLHYAPDAMPMYVADSDDGKPVPRLADPQDEWKQNRLMPGRSLKRSYQLNFMFILTDVLGRSFTLPDEDRVAQLLMQIAGRCMMEEIPQATAQSLVMCHPLLNTDVLLVEKTFEAAYCVKNIKKYWERNKTKPLKSVPEDTLLMMKTDIFLNTNYEMRKNVMTGVAQYRDKNSEDTAFYDLSEDVCNTMTLRAKEMGLKSWDKDIARFINSSRIEFYDPVNDWMDHLPRWDGRDRIKALAARVPCRQPHWEKYFRTWMLAMTAHWMGRAALTGNALTPLLIGRQGCGKTSFCRILLPPELRDYYNDRINFKNETDLNLGLTSFALINIDEFDKTTARQQVVLKYLLSTADVKFRPPYGKAYRQYRRYASFIGTTNSQQPLNDPTGSRRFICAEVTGQIDFSDTLDHRQIFAQLKQQVEQGVRYWLTDDETALLIEENERFRNVSSLEELISNMFRRPDEGETASWLSLTEVMESLQRRYGKAALKDVSPTKVGLVLSGKVLNFEKKRSKEGVRYLMAEV